MTHNTSDPDLNLHSFNDHGIFTIEELNELSTIVKPHLSALHLNIRSLSKHFDELCNLLDSTPFEFDLIACSETWITPQVDTEEMQITGYNMIKDSRMLSTGGGVALYLKSSFDYNLRDDLKIVGIENIWVDTQDLLIGVIYNPPNRSQREFLDEFEQVLHSIFLSKRRCLILGDININTLVKSTIAKEYLNLIHSEGFIPLIFEATRITETTISCIDHIHSNFVSSSTSGSIAIEIADHLPVFTLSYDPTLNPFPDTVEIRDFKRFDKIAFCDGLRNENWKSVYNTSDANESFTRFSHTFNRISNKHAPIKTIKIKSKSNKPWVTKGLKKSIKVRNQLYKNWLTTRNSYYYNRYKIYRNKIVSINKRFRTLYYDTVFKDSTNTKKMWDNVNLIINKKRSSSLIDNLQVKGKNFQQPASISNALNTYFCNVPTELASKLPKPDRRFSSYMKRKKCSFRFSKVSEVEVFLLLNGIDCKKSFGFDMIHPLLLFTAALEIYRPLTYIINLSLKQGIFPESLKIAKVIPIFKQGSRSSCNNYRPISVLSALSKIFERCILNQLTFYFTTENLLVSNQYGFRSGNTTTDCLVDLVDEVTRALDEGKYAVSLFLDLSKAFDTVNHSILLSKLDLYGIRAKENQWFRSYLSKRKQKVFVNGVQSNFLPLNSGVPQGSILGPLLFIIYINDIVEATNYFFVRLFADDTSLTATGKDLDVLLQRINSELPAIYEWLCANKLTLNSSKMKYLVFQPRQKFNYNLYPPLKLADQYLEHSFTVKYLGLIIDCSLS